MQGHRQETTPKISVVLPTYNQCEYLPQALDSIFCQTGRDFELIVVNDGSTDDTAQVLDRYYQRYHNQIPFRVVHQENQKLPRALNAGFREARGAYLTWTSSDNLMHPEMLETLSAALDTHPQIGLVYADWEVIDAHGQLLRTVETFEYDRHILLRTNFVNACFLYRRACQDKIGLYDPEFIYAEDWEYWIRISRHFPMMRVPKVLYRFRTHSKSLTETVVKEKSVKPMNPARARTTIKMEQLLRGNLFDWYLSKLKFELVRRRTGKNQNTTAR